MPGLFEPTFHDILSGNSERSVPAILSPKAASLASPTQIRQAIREAYSQMQRRYPNYGISCDKMGEAIDRFLLENRVP
jgi:hypothetical protein